MVHSQFSRPVARHNSRTRTVSAAGAAVLLFSIALSACSSSSGGGGKPTGTGGSLAGTTVVVTGQGGSVKAGYDKIFQMFTDKTGIKVKYVDGVISSELEQIHAQGSHPAVDIFMATSTSELQYPDLWRTITTAEVPNVANLPADLQKDQLGVADGNIANAIEYNAKVFKEKGWAPPTSYQDLWDPKYKGHVALYPASFATQEAWLAQIAPEFGGSTTNMNPVFDKLKELKPQLYTVVSTPTLLDQAFIQGNAWISVNNTQRISLLNAQTKGDVDLVYPSEGILWLTAKMMVPKNDSNPQGAYALIDYFLSPEVQNQLAQLITESPVVNGTTVPADLAKFLPDPSQKGYYADWPNLVPLFPGWVESWNKIFTS